MNLFSQIAKVYRQRWFYLAALIALGAPVGRAAAASDMGLEYRIKAAYLYNFTKFIEWPPPATPNASFVLGVVDPDGFAYNIVRESVNGKTMPNGRAIVVRRLISLEADATTCNQIFVTRSSGLDVAQIRKTLEGLPIVVVGETAGFAEQGGVIGFVLTGDAVHCEINLAGAQRAGVKLSGRLASIARLVHEIR